MLMHCTGFAFLLVTMTCEVPTPPPSPDSFCTSYIPVRWSSQDTRQTKEQVDRLNRRWKLRCKK